MRPKLLLPMALCVLLLSQPGWADPVMLVRRDQEGDRMRVTEEQEAAGSIRRTRMGRRRGNSFSAFRELRQREYSETVVAHPRTDTGLAWERHYDVATLSTTPPDAPPEPLGTRLLGRTVRVGLVHGVPTVECDEGRVQGDDLQDVKLANMVYACLPLEPVHRGDRWLIEPEALGRALVGDKYDPARYEAEAGGRLRSFRTVDGQQCAQVELAIRFSREQTVEDAGVLLELEGELLFSLDAGRILRFELSGNEVTDGLRRENSNEPIEVHEERQLTLRYLAELLEPIPADGE